jgi:hypothetical protein
MKSGAENRKKTIIAGALGAVALICVIYIFTQIFGGSSDSTPAPQQPATLAAKPEAGEPASTTPKASSNNGAPVVAIPGVDAQKLASTSSSLDPTLDESAMLRTESLVYSGAGRNIFSLVSEPAPAPVPLGPLPPARPKGPQLPPPPPPPPPTCPPSCPPINLKFFGTAQRGNAKQAFLLQGEDVYLATAGDIVAHKYKIVSIATTSIQVQDLSNGNTQTLPLQQ